jgi:hypothetical protein
VFELSGQRPVKGSHTWPACHNVWKRRFYNINKSDMRYAHYVRAETTFGIDCLNAHTLYFCAVAVPCLADLMIPVIALRVIRKCIACVLFFFYLLLLHNALTLVVFHCDAAAHTRFKVQSAGGIRHFKLTFGKIDIGIYDVSSWKVVSYLWLISI